MIIIIIFNFFVTSLSFLLKWRILNCFCFISIPLRVYSVFLGYVFISESKICCIDFQVDGGKTTHLKNRGIDKMLINNHRERIFFLAILI
jgi:hypothetical protein